MTQAELEQLSEQVAEKRGCAPFWYGVYDEDDIAETEIWLYQDSRFCFELAVDNSFEITIFDETVRVVWFENGANIKIKTEDYTDHNNDKHQATRVAILKAYLAKD